MMMTMTKICNRRRLDMRRDDDDDDELTDSMTNGELSSCAVPPSSMFDGLWESGKAGLKL